jgi:hypothetical protein
MKILEDHGSNGWSFFAHDRSFRYLSSVHCANMVAGRKNPLSQFRLLPSQRIVAQLFQES